MRKPTKRAKSKILTPHRIREEELVLPGSPPRPSPLTAAECLTTRQSTHGDFSENARVMQGVKRVLRTGENWKKFLVGGLATELGYVLDNVQAEAIEMIVVKLGRIVTGDPNHADNWLDIEGYARLARERLA